MHISLWKDFRDYYVLTIERLALIVFLSLNNFNLHLLFIMVQQCTYQSRLHQKGHGQVKDYNEYIHNLSLLNQVDLFQYINILHHKNIAQFHETGYLFVNNKGIIYIMLGHIILTVSHLA